MHSLGNLAPVPKALDGDSGQGGQPPGGCPTGR